MKRKRGQMKQFFKLQVQGALENCHKCGQLSKHAWYPPNVISHGKTPVVTV